MTPTDLLLANNERYAASFTLADLPSPPSRRLAIVSCMDARLNVYGMLDLKEGEAHVIRNAGGVVTQDVIRSLAISQRLLGTQEVMVIQHTDCGMLSFRDDDLRQQIQQETGVRPPFAFEAFTSLEQEVRQSLERIRRSPFLLCGDRARGFVYEVETGRLREITL